MGKLNKKKFAKVTHLISVYERTAANETNISWILWGLTGVASLLAAGVWQYWPNVHTIYTISNTPQIEHTLHEIKKNDNLKKIYENINSINIVANSITPIIEISKYTAALQKYYENNEKGKDERPKPNDDATPRKDKNRKSEKPTGAITPGKKEETKKEAKDKTPEPPKKPERTESEDHTRPKD